MLTKEKIGCLKFNGKEYYFSDIDPYCEQKSFEEYKDYFDKCIICADQDPIKVLELLNSPIDFDSDMNYFNLYNSLTLFYFDNWYIAMRMPEMR